MILAAMCAFAGAVQVTNENFQEAVDCLLDPFPRFPWGWCPEFGPPRDWDTSKVTRMYKTFQSFQGDDLPWVTDFDSELDLSGWDTSRVTDMTQMFWRAKNLNLNIGAWDTSKVTTMRATFAIATAYTIKSRDGVTASVACPEACDACV